MLEVEGGKCWKYTDLIVEGRSILNDPQEPLYSQATVDQLVRELNGYRVGAEFLEVERDEATNALRLRIMQITDIRNELAATEVLCQKYREALEWAAAHIPSEATLPYESGGECSCPICSVRSHTITNRSTEFVYR